MFYKKFLIFVVILISALSIGMTAYYFLRDTEVIIMKNVEVYANVGDTFEIQIERRDEKAKTSISFSVENEDLIEQYETGKFRALSGGKTEIVLVTNKKRIETQKCIVYVGAGSSDSPYFVKDAESFQNIGAGADSVFALDKNYKLTGDLDLSSLANFAPIGMNENTAFTGVFDGNGYTISNLTFNAESNLENVGLFSVIGENGVVKNLNLTNINLNGNIMTGGIVAGTNKGIIECVNISNCSLSSSYAGKTNLGGVVAYNGILAESTAKIDRVACNVNISGANANIGGLAVENSNAKIMNSYFQGDIKNDSESNDVAGLVVNNKAQGQKFSKIEKSYSVANFAESQGNKYGLVASNENGDNVENYLLGLYYDSDVAGKDVKLDPKTGKFDLFEINAKTTEDMKKVESYIYFVDKNSSSTHYWNFNIIWSMNLIENQVYPMLQMKGNEGEIAHPLKDPTKIEKAAELQGIALDGNYTLIRDIDLSDLASWTPIGTKEAPFQGELDGKNFKIKNLKLQSERELNGLFGVLGSNARITNIVIEGVEITKGTIVGVLAGENNGYIENVKVLGSSNLNKIEIQNSVDSIVGGLVGVSNGTINGCEINIDIIANEAEGVNNGNANICIGGVVGKNNGYIQKSKSASIIKSNANRAYIGGIVGENNKEISDGKFKGNITANTSLENTYIGGVAGYNLTGGNIIGAMVKSKLEGYNAGGLVGYNNYGIVEQSCVLNGTEIKGVKAGGLISTLARGQVFDCYTLALLKGLENSSVKKAGFAVYVHGYTNILGKGECAELYHCFSACSFDNLGENYAETSSQVRISVANTSNGKEAGYIYDSIYDSTVANGAKVQIGSGNFWGKGDNSGHNHGKHYDNMDGRNSTDSCKKVGIFTGRGFSIEVWNLVDGEYPTLANVNDLSYFEVN